MKKTLFLYSIGLIFAVLFVADANATVVIFGDGALGHYTGSLTYSASSATNAILSITLKNTSPAANGGYLTAFAFNNPGNFITGMSLLATDPDFGLLGGSSFNNGVNASPYGNFDIGASTGGGFEGGGNPNEGIGVGITEMFTFIFAGSNLDTLDENSFMSEFSSGTGAGGGYQPFVARFRGFEDDGSDKVPDDSHNTPEPAALSVLGIGLFGFFRLRHKIKIF